MQVLSGLVLTRAAPPPGAPPARPAPLSGANAVPNSVFEDHAGSKVRRPAQFTYLTAYNMSLKELGQLVNSTYIDSHISYCILVRVACVCVFVCVCSYVCVLLGHSCDLAGG